MIKINLSIIICTYNPNQEILNRCLNALYKALANINSFELLIIDNNSPVPIATLCDQTHLKNNNGRIILESKQGLTPARLKGIQEALGEIILFVDDDNIVREDFIVVGAKLATENPHIGAWSGQVHLIFETPPADWTKNYWGLLVHRVFDQDRWSNLPHLPDTMPCGAGLFVRQAVAQYYLSLHTEGKRNIQLDRTGNSLLSAGDNDLAACACDIGLGTGLFKDLVLEHYIPTNRLQKKYLLKLAEGIAASAIIFKSFRNEYPTKTSLKNNIANLLRLILKDHTSREFFRAVLKGEKIGKEILKNNQSL